MPEAYDAVQKFFEDALAKRIASNPARAQKIGGVYEFVMDGQAERTWHLDMTVPVVRQGPAPKMGVRIRMKSEDFIEVAEGRLNEMQAFTGGKIKIEGNLMMAMKLRDVLRPQGWGP